MPGTGRLSIKLPRALTVRVGELLDRFRPSPPVHLSASAIVVRAIEAGLPAVVAELEAGAPAAKESP